MELAASVDRVHFNSEQSITSKSFSDIPQIDTDLPHEVSNTNGSGPEPLSVPDLWVQCIHPQGTLYFYHPVLKVVTDEDMGNPAVRQSMTEYYGKFCRSLGSIELEDGMELYLHADTPADSTAWQFDLVVNHNFCLASYNFQDVRNEVAAHLDHRILNKRRRMYWNYVYTHPSHAPLSERAMPDAADAIAWFYTDNFISGPRSVVPFSKAECDDINRMVQTLSQPSYNGSTAKTVFLAWLLREVCRFRDAEHYGEHTLKQSQQFHASRNRGQQTPPQPHQRLQPAVDFIIRFLFFGIPRTYLAHIKSSGDYRGRLSSIHANWVAYIERLVREYSHFLLISTVLLSATVGLLAVPGIGNVVAVAALISAFASLGSIILSVVSIWRHQINTQPRNSFMYMYNIQQSPLGLQGHAMFLSLPPVLLVWCIVTFTAALISYTLQGIINPTLGTDADNNDDGATQMSSASGWVVISILLVILVSVLGGLYTFTIIWKFRSPASRFRALFSSCFPVRRRHVDASTA